MQVSEVMTRNSISVRPSATIAEAAHIMLYNHVSGLPVLDDGGALTGIVTEGDLLRRVELGTEGEPPGRLRSFFAPGAVAADYVATRGRHVGDVMTRDPAFVTPDAPLAEAVKLMHDKHFKRLPVLQDGKLVGIVSRTDLLRALVTRLIETRPPCTDEEIVARIKAELAYIRWQPRSAFSLSVKDRIVMLDGTIFSEEERQAVNVIAENVPGVREVKNNLIIIDPDSGMAFPVGGG